MNTHKPDLVIFDFDGTLFDTATANYYAYHNACKQIIGDACTFSEEFFRSECFSKNYKDFLPLIGITDTTTIHKIHDLKKGTYSNYYSYIRPNKALLSLAQTLKSSGVPICIATTASTANTQDVLNHFHFAKLFDLVVAQESVSNLKPAPDVFLYAMNYYSVNPDSCIIFEDSDLGIEAAKKSGASVFRVESF